MALAEIMVNRYLRCYYFYSDCSYVPEEHFVGRNDLRCSSFHRNDWWIDYIAK